jgi:hypothetical protein
MAIGWKSPATIAAGLTFPRQNINIPATRQGCRQNADLLRKSAFVAPMKQCLHETRAQ